MKYKEMTKTILDKLEDIDFKLFPDEVEFLKYLLNRELKELDECLHDEQETCDVEKRGCDGCFYDNHVPHVD